MRATRIWTASFWLILRLEPIWSEISVRQTVVAVLEQRIHTYIDVSFIGIHRKVHLNCSKRYGNEKLAHQFYHTFNVVGSLIPFPGGLFSADKLNRAAHPY